MLLHFKNLTDSLDKSENKTNIYNLYFSRQLPPSILPDIKNEKYSEKSLKERENLDTLYVVREKKERIINSHQRRTD